MSMRMKRTSAATLVFTALYLTAGCGSDSDVVLVDTAENTGATGTDGAVDSGSSSDNATGAGSETIDSDATGNEANNGASNEASADTDNNELVSPVASEASEALYSVRFVASWSEETHPVNFPSNPHFSPLTGAVHNEQVILWEPGQNASDGIEVMAETGGTGPLLNEIQAATDQGYVLSSIEGGGVAESPGAIAVEFLVNRDYPLVTLVSMLAPSPDWFVGVHGLQMVNQNGSFIDSVTVDLNLYDSGTDGGERYTSPDEDIPRSPIGLVNSFPSDSDFLEGQPSVGSFIFTRMQ